MNRAPDPSLLGDWMLYEPEKEKPRMLQGWRTIIFGSLLAVVGVLQTADWTQILPAQYIGPVTAGIGFAVIWLRSITKTSVGVK